MSPASAAAVVLQRPLLLHLPRPPRHIPATCTSLRSACSALRVLQPLKLPELPFLLWSDWRRHRGAPCLLKQRHQIWICSATGTGGSRLAARKASRQATAVIDARPPNSGGFVGNPEQLTDEAQHAVELPKKRGRGRPKSSPVPQKNSSAELPENATAAVLEASLSGTGTTEVVGQLVKEVQTSVSDPVDSATPAPKPRRGRPKKIVSASPDEPASDRVDERIEPSPPQKTKRSTKRKMSSSTTKAAGIELMAVEADLIVKPSLLESAVGSESVTVPAPTKSELSPPSPIINAVCKEDVDTESVPLWKIERTEVAQVSLPPPELQTRGKGVPLWKIERTGVAQVSLAPPAFQTRGKGERVKQDERSRTPTSHASSGISFVQILGTGMDTGDTAPSVLLFFDKRRVIFNAGEGLQRFCIEHKIKLSKIDHLFLTRVSSETANGIPGLLLTLAGIGDIKAPIDIWGTSELQYFVDAMRTFVPNASVVNTHSFGHESGQVASTDSLDVLFHDEFLTISTTLLHPSTEANSGLNSDNSTDRTKTDAVAFDDYRGRKRHYDSTPRITDAVGGCKPGDISVIYVCELPEVKGKFNPDKAKLLGIRPGRKYSELQNGKPVPRDDNKGMVHPHEVMAPSSAGPIFVLVDCPTLDHLPSLLSKSCLDDFYPKQGTCKTVSCMVHIGPVSVTNDLKYQQWMALFSETNHILAGHGLHNLQSPILKASARVISKLNYICPQVFPNCCLEPEDRLEVGRDCATNSEIGVSRKELEPKAVQSKFVISKADNLLKFRLRPLPALGLDCASVPGNFYFAEVRDQLIADTPEIKEARDEVQRLWLSGAEGDGNKIQEVAAETSNFYPVEEPFLVDYTPKISRNSKGEDKVFTGGSAHQGSTEMDLSVDDDIPDCLKNVHRDEMEIVFLGTGSSQPSKYRNVSAIFINLFDRGAVMLDCGEGTYGQLKRRFGLDGADAIIMGLKCVWISHIHADHHTGLSRILAVRKALLEKHARFSPILVIGPRQLRRYLDAYAKLEDLGMIFLDCSHTTEPETEMDDVVKGNLGNVSTYNSATRGSERRPLQGVINSSTVDKRVDWASGSPKRNQMQNYWLLPGYNLGSRDEVGQSNLKQVLDSLGLKSLVSVPVVHCPQAFGVVLQSSGRPDRTGVVRAGWKLAYSGDTRPCRKLLEACEGATVLIHEATFDDGMAEEAKMKKHSMTCEAIETGRQGNVFRTILTHFSQRYPKIPVFDESYTDRTCIAFDMMSVNLADLPVLPRLLPALKLLFRDDLIDAEEAAEDGEVVEY